MDIVKSFAFVFFFVLTALFGSIWLSGKLFNSGRLRWLSLTSTQERSEGFVAAPAEILELTGREGVAYSMLRPSGKVMIDGRVYDAIAESSWISKGSRVKVVRQESMQLYVAPIV
jgi:membrane-bound serine protease (ClpP class)